jgi:hypothetical protein
MLPNNHRIHDFDFGFCSMELAQELQRSGYRLMALEPMDDGYLKDQGYLFLFDTAVAIEVFDNLSNAWEELQELNNFQNRKG